ncbi:hypothetical protein [Caballeronia glebae]|uniref:hypothetical protein n=1 Tax=Caballeronia glebae TaxID=1777143 RepID=UPI0038B7CDD2
MCLDARVRSTANHGQSSGQPRVFASLDVRLAPRREQPERVQSCPLRLRNKLTSTGIFDIDDKFNEEVLEVARAIKRERPDWAIVWWDECKLSTLVRSGGETLTRNLFEFEVTADGWLEPASNAD